MSHPYRRVDGGRTYGKQAQIDRGAIGAMISLMDEFRNKDRAFTGMRIDQDLISDDPHTFFSHTKLIGPEVYTGYGLDDAGFTIAADQLGTRLFSEGPFVRLHRLVEQLKCIQWNADRSGDGRGQRCWRGRIRRR